MEKQKSDDFYDGLEGNKHEYEGGVNDLSQSSNPENSAVQQEEWKQELAKLEDEIQTLRSVLSVKIRQSNDLKKKLGVTPLGEFRQDLRSGFETIKGSDVVQKTNEKLHTWGESVANSDAVQKTNTALKSFGAYASRKLGDIRNSNAMKSMEGKLSDAYTNVKTSRSIGSLYSATKMTTSPSANDVNSGSETAAAAADVESKPAE